MDAPVPDDAMRQWAREQMKDSRFMSLPADLLRLLICYVRDAAVEEHCAKPIEIAKEMIWNAEKPEILNCQCGAMIVMSDEIYGGAGCSRYKCEIYQCNSCMMRCNSCAWAVCTEHAVDELMVLHTCGVCKSKMCRNCTADDEDCICSRCGRKICSRCVDYIPAEGNAMICDPMYGCVMQN